MPEEVPQPQTQAPTPPPAPQPGTPNPYNQPPKKNTGLLVGIIIAAVLIIAGVATALIIMLSGDKDDTKKDNSTDSSQKADDNKEDQAEDEAKRRAANAKTASSSLDLSAVCDDGSITNAADFKAPYKVAAFSKSSDRNSWSSIFLQYDAPYTAEYSKYETVNVVACITENADAAVKSKTCEFKSGGETVKIDYFATTYTIAVHEAKSGKKIKDLGTVSGPATTCPSFVSYNKNDPKIIAKPDTAAVDAAILKFTKE